jgi:uncharacterized protein (TIGR02145 family)
MYHNQNIELMKKRSSAIITPILILGLLLSIACSNSERTNNNSQPETGSFTDPRDGKTYKTVKIGDQWIMAENLAYKPGIGNFWAYENNDSNIATYGYLYDWETAMNIAPDGWHLPSREEWMNILKKLGARWNTYPYLEKVYPKMIVGGSSGLDMLLGGMRTCGGEYRSLGDRARFWNSDNSGSEKTAYGLNSNKGGYPHGLRGSTAPHVWNNTYQRSCPGYSVRLFKD